MVQTPSRHAFSNRGMKQGSGSHTTGESERRHGSASRDDAEYHRLSRTPDCDNRAQFNVKCLDYFRFRQAYAARPSRPEINITIPVGSGVLMVVASNRTLSTAKYALLPVTNFAAIQMPIALFL